MFLMRLDQLLRQGTCLKDQGALQASETVRRLVGVCRIPEPRFFEPLQGRGGGRVALRGYR